MSGYVQALTDNNVEFLDEIFTSKYRKFIKFYYLISEYSDKITSIKYNQCTDDVLKISLSVTGNHLDKIMNSLSKKIGNSDDVLIYNQKKMIHIEITSDESGLP